MATERLVAGTGQGLTWGNAVTGSVLNGLAGAAVLSDVVIDNSVALDYFADLSINFASATFAAISFMQIFLYPLNQDGTTYGDGQTGSFAHSPGQNYLCGNIYCVTGTQAQNGVLQGIVMPPDKFKFVFAMFGTTLASSGNTALYRTYGRKVI